MLIVGNLAAMFPAGSSGTAFREIGNPNFLTSLSERDMKEHAVEGHLLWFAEGVCCEVVMMTRRDWMMRCATTHRSSRDNCDSSGTHD